jgi:hypothetical protein
LPEKCVAGIFIMLKQALYKNRITGIPPVVTVIRVLKKLCSNGSKVTETHDYCYYLMKKYR